MKIETNAFKTVLVMIILLAFGACNNSGKSDNEVEKVETEVAKNEEEEAPMDHEEHMAIALSAEKTTIWKPSGIGTEIIGRDFHFIAGSVDKINPEVRSEGEENVLQLNANGDKSAFVFHTKMGNMGIAVTLKRDGYQGKLKIIHHAQDADTYEFVSINRNSMIQGRVVNGEVKIFDTKNFESNVGDWMTIKVSAAGSHFKGYLGDKNITHGHGDEMEAGYVGIMTEGTGKIIIKSIEITPMEAE